LPDDELEIDPVADTLLVDTLMGWDGDPCLCIECACPRFRDGTDDGRCPDCRAGRHWLESGTGEG
jgi:hypothetical protein